MGEQMVDCEGNPVAVGADVMFRDGGVWRRGTVREVSEQRYSRQRGGPIIRWEANVDDGDSGNPDLKTNRFMVAAWVQSKQIRVRIARRAP